MTGRRLGLLGLVLSLLLAGCNAPSEPGDDGDLPPPPSQTESSQPAPELFTFSISALASFGSRSGPVPYSGHLGSMDGPEARTGGTVQTLHNATALLAETQLDCATPCNVWLTIYSAQNEKVAESGPVAGGRISLLYSPEDGLPPGEWFLRLFNEGTAAKVEGELRASVFQGAVPSGYTAF